jgi:hypothetical protein
MIKLRPGLRSFIRQVFPTKKQIVAGVLLACLGGCQGPPSAPQDQAGSESEAGYVAPPAATDALVSARGVSLRGAAAAGAAVQLATPAGEAVSTRADAEGRWRLDLPPSGQARIFGLSAESGGRRVQSQGYLLVGPRGQTAVLRAGAAALRLDHAAGSRIASLDFDGEGGALLSGWAAGGTDVLVRLDGKPVGEARTDDAGRFTLALPRLAAGPHRIEATGVAFTDELQMDASPAAPLAAGPLNSEPIPRGLRADWLTPGGGIQSTILAG